MKIRFLLSETIDPNILLSPSGHVFTITFLPVVFIQYNALIRGNSCKNTIFLDTSNCTESFDHTIFVKHRAFEL